MDEPAPVNATVAAVYIQQALGKTIKPGTIRQWAHRRHIGNHNHRYNLTEIHRHITGQDPHHDEDR